MEGREVSRALRPNSALLVILTVSTGIKGISKPPEQTGERMLASPAAQRGT